MHPLIPLHRQRNEGVPFHQVRYAEWRGASPSDSHVTHGQNRAIRARFRLSTSVLKGMNNRIKVIKRMAYAYRDNAYFFRYRKQPVSQAAGFGGGSERGAKRAVSLATGKAGNLAKGIGSMAANKIKDRVAVTSGGRLASSLRANNPSFEGDSLAGTAEHTGQDKIDA